MHRWASLLIHLKLAAVKQCQPFLLRRGYLSSREDLGEGGKTGNSKYPKSPPVEWLHCKHTIPHGTNGMVSRAARRPLSRGGGVGAPCCSHWARARPSAWETLHLTIWVPHPEISKFRRLIRPNQTQKRLNIN